MDFKLTNIVYKRLAQKSRSSRSQPLSFDKYSGTGGSKKNSNVVAVLAIQLISENKMDHQVEKVDLHW